MASLVLRHFYDRSRCRRLTDSPRLGVLQCGALYEVEKDGPGCRFPDEVSGAETYERGTVAMGNQGPGTNGSEFFIVHSFAHIPAQYSVLGKVVRGMAALDRMVADGIVPSDPDGPLDGAPKHPVKIERASFGW
ncbi:peptidylprolyl isomerase [Amycolatopsis sp. FDAARGOS 1241]|nr:peptidylprolyl isomerase [Amycolatopsis sp. FDAARGOS 1241]